MVLPRLPLGLAGEAGEEGPGLPRGAGPHRPMGLRSSPCPAAIFLMCAYVRTLCRVPLWDSDSQAAQLWLSLVLWMERRGVRELVLFLALTPCWPHDMAARAGVAPEESSLRVRARGPVMADAALAGRRYSGCRRLQRPAPGGVQPHRGGPSGQAARRLLSASPGGPGSSQLPVHVGWDFCSFTRACEETPCGLLP